LRDVSLQMARGAELHYCLCSPLANLLTNTSAEEGVLSAKLWGTAESAVAFQVQPTIVGRMIQMPSQSS
jgi:hypothetical protein